MIKGNTNIVGLIGNPVEHSLSPSMHNAAFKKLGLNYVYVPFNVFESDLEMAIYGANSLNIKGLNVTIPHKIKVINYLDKLDPIAKLIGAVNTIDFKELKGYNTDGIGAIKAIEEITSIKNKNIVVAGAGGASRSISFYLASKKPNSLNILNRDKFKAQSLANDILSSKFISNINYGSIDEIGEYLKDADILIDTTSIGMSPNNKDKPIANANQLNEDLIVNDIVYNPIETSLLKEAKIANSKVISGLKMLLYQGAESFKIWTGYDAPIKVMEDALLKGLNLK